MADKNIFRKHIAIPQDHGSWVFILSPLLIGIFAGGKFTPASLNLVIAAMSVFMLRQPTTTLIKIYSKRSSRDELTAARFWFVFYAAVVLLAIFELALSGFAYLLYLALPAALVFAWHLWLVSKREERRRVNLEILATGVLSLAAPAAPEYFTMCLKQVNDRIKSLWPGLFSSQPPTTFPPTITGTKTLAFVKQLAALKLDGNQLQ